MTQLSVSPVLLVPVVVILALLVALAVVGRVPLSYNLRNLLVRWRMTALTALAFTLVIGLLTVMFAFVNGMTKLTEESGHPENVIVLADGSNDESFSSLTFTDTSDIDHEPGVALGSGGQPLCSREVYIMASMPVPPKEGKAPAQQARGKVKKVLAGDLRLIVTDEQDEDHAFRLDSNKVLLNDQPGTVEYLKPGDILWLAYEQRGGEPVITELRASSRRRFVQIRGVEDPLVAAEVHGLELLDGQWFSEAGVERLPAAEPGKEPESAVQVVLGEGAAKALAADFGKQSLAVGDVFEMGPMKWKVVGVLKSSGTIFGSEVWAKRTYVGQRYGKEYTISSITIRTVSPEAAEKLAESLKEFKKAKLNPLTEIAYYSQQRAFANTILVAVIVLTVFMAAGGIFGVMNTMFAAISQRIKDIGVLRIIGFARWQILVSFLLESLAIALVGGLLGFALGTLATLYNGGRITGVVGSAQGWGKTVELRLWVTANTLLAGMLLTLLMGLFGGLLPALSAMRLKPLESMR